MDKKDLLFYEAYEQFYIMADKSVVFKDFCNEAFGADFSQDGFSNLEQINMILKYIPQGENIHILDIGCGNGKMLGYLQEKTGAYIHGFDYSEKAIETANKLFPDNSEFVVGTIDDVDYDEKFDLIISMDTLYFAKDMSEFISHVKRWLKKDGIFFVGYQEGEIMPKTESANTTVLAKVLDENQLKYQVTDITEQTYNLLKRKREAALLLKKDFEAEGNLEWFNMLIAQTDIATKNFEEFRNEMSRYIYVVKKR